MTCRHDARPHNHTCGRASRRLHAPHIATCHMSRVVASYIEVSRTMMHLSRKRTPSQRAALGRTTTKMNTPTCDTSSRKRRVSDPALRVLTHARCHVRRTCAISSSSRRTAGQRARKTSTPYNYTRPPEFARSDPSLTNTTYRTSNVATYRTSHVMTCDDVRFPTLRNRVTGVSTCAQ
jgi:hypothetical protein